MATIVHTLFGSCACERNQYTVTVPAAEIQNAQVFFDNSSATRRFQATPVSAWLRIPLSWYSSFTVAQFEDESHVLIKRNFYSPDPSHVHDDQRMVRRQFCGFCGTHLTKADESASDRPTSHESIDVTLGSLEEKSIEALEALSVLPSESEEDDEGYDYLQRQRELQESAEDAAAGLVKDDAMINDEDHIQLDTDPTAADLLQTGSMINEESHIPTAGQQQPSTVPGPSSNNPSTASVTIPVKKYAPIHQMHHRGIPFFESMLENSRLGRIKRRTGAHMSSDGRVHVQWEVVEIGDEPAFQSVPGDPFGYKRLKIGA